MALEENAAPSWFVLAAKEIEEGRLSSSIGSDDGLESKRIHSKVNLINGNIAPKTNCKISRFNYWYLGQNSFLS